MAKRTQTSRLLRAAGAVSLMLAVASCVSSGDTQRVDDNGEDDKVRIARLMRFCQKMRVAGDLAVAAGMCRRAHEVSPDSIQPLIELGQILGEMGGHTEATQVFMKALGVESSNTEAYLGLGRAYIALQDYDLARESLESALKYNDRDHRVFNALGVVHDLTGDHQKAQAYYDAGLELTPDNVSLRNNLGLSLSLSGNDKDSIEVLGDLAEEHAGDATSRQNLSFAYGISGDLESAEKVGRIDLPAPAVANNIDYFAVHGGRSGMVDDAAARQVEVIEAPPVDDAGDGDGDAMANLGDDADRLLGAKSGPVSPGGPWGVQVGAYRDNGGAVDGWQGLNTKVPDLLGDLSPSVQRADLGAGAGTIFRLRGASFDTRRNAEIRCAKLIERNIPCLVVRLDGLAGPATSVADAGGDRDGEGGTYTVQLGAYRKSAQSDQAMKKIRTSVPDLLAQIRTEIQRADLGPALGGVYYRIRTVPLPDRSRADNFCLSLLARGVECMVVRLPAARTAKKS